MNEPRLEDFNISQADLEWHQWVNQKFRNYDESIWTTKYLAGADGFGTATGMCIMFFFFIPIFIVCFIYNECAKSKADALRQTLRWNKVQKYHDAVVEAIANKKYIEEQAKIKELEELLKKKYFWQSLRGVDFEYALGRVLQNNGYSVKLTSAVGDGGVDLYLKDLNENKVIVKCKAHEKPVGVAAARDLFGTLHAEKVEYAILASVSGFTRGVHEFIEGKPMRLLDLDEIIKMA